MHRFLEPGDHRRPYERRSAAVRRVAEKGRAGAGALIRGRFDDDDGGACDEGAGQATPLCRRARRLRKLRRHDRRGGPFRRAVA